MDRKAAKYDEVTNHRSALESMGKGGWRRDRASVIEVRASRSVTWLHLVRVQRSPSSSVRFGNDAFTRQDLLQLDFLDEFSSPKTKGVQSISKPLSYRPSLSAQCWTHT
jgi:hypothetical protein